MRELITTCLEVAGMLALSTAGAVAVSAYTLAGAIATGGALLIGSSFVLNGRRPKIKPTAGESVA